MKNPTTAKRLAQALLRQHMKPQELSNASGVSKASISQYLSGSHAPSNNSSEKMANVLKVNPVWLMGFDAPMTSQATPSAQSPVGSVTINIFGRVTADLAIEVGEDIIDTEEIPKRLAESGEFFGLQIHGDNMEPKFSEGDVVIVRRQEDAKSGDIVIAAINGDDATCKRLRKYRDGIELISTNPSYEPVFFNNDDISNKSVRIIGKVVELRAKF